MEIGGPASACSLFATLSVRILCPPAHRSAASSRSLPQNSSPSSVVKLGAPNRPSRCASSVCARSRALFASDRAAASTGDGSICKVASTSSRTPIVVDPAAVTELRAEQGDAKGLAPALIERDQCDARRQQAVLRKGIGATERHIQVRAQPLEVAPHVAALLRIEIERRRGPALCLEDRPEQERPEAHAHVGARGQGPNPHRRRIGVGRGEIEPEIERGRHGVMLEHDPEKWVPVFGKDHAPPKGSGRGR